VAVDAELRAPAGLHPLRPWIAEKPVGEEPELERLAGDDVGADPLRPVPLTGEGDLVGAGLEVGVDGARGAGARLEGAALGGDELEQHVGQGHVALVTHVSDQHAVLQGQAANRGSIAPAAANPSARSRQLWQVAQGTSHRS
jgi:hypothetical protein